ncbi:MAG: hypothetical protein L0323_16370 [Planctomycetes bacterium]|nr:hypothetical protein [Planctomycetota bacterium]
MGSVAELTGFNGSAEGFSKAAACLRRVAQPDGSLAEIVIPGGRTAYPRVGTWPVPGLLRARRLHSALEMAAQRREQVAGGRFHELS